MMQAPGVLASHPGNANAATRELKPRPPVVARPSYVSQENVLTILGIVPRKYLERIVPLCTRVTRIGKTVLVELDEAERVIRELASGEAEAAHGVENDVPQTVDGVLARLGYQRA